MEPWKIRNKEEEYDVSFLDDILEKCLGQYSRVCKKMSEINSECKEWVLQSNFSINHPVGSFSCTLNFYYDGKVVIYNTAVPRMSGHNINDVRFLKKAITWMGWKILTCTPAEIESSMEFWKRCWETGLIESEYISKKYKKKD